VPNLYATLENNSLNMALKWSLKLLLLATAIFMILAGFSWSLTTSYGSISGHVTVNQSITWDLLESYSDVQTSPTNDTFYVLETTHQGETKWVKLKIINAADVSIAVNLSISGAGGAGDGINISLWNENKTSQLATPINVQSSTYVWIKHEVATSAAPGDYSFNIDVTPT